MLNIRKLLGRGEPGQAVASASSTIAVTIAYGEEMGSESQEVVAILVKQQQLLADLQQRLDVLALRHVEEQRERSVQRGEAAYGEPKRSFLLSTKLLGYNKRSFACGCL